VSARSEQVIAILNESLRAKLKAVYLHCDSARAGIGDVTLTAAARECALFEMREAERICARILELGGAPDVERGVAIAPARDVCGGLKGEINDVEATIRRLTQGIAYSRELGDLETATLLDDVRVSWTQRLIAVEVELATSGQTLTPHPGSEEGG
jgi:bacterioferritin (cytochrome b1)